MNLSIVIVSWNVRALLEKCLASIFLLHEHCPCAFEVIVVDNASCDGSAEMVETKFPQVKFFAQKENLGFSRANNIGIQNAKGTYLLLLNPDTECIEPFIENLVRKMESDASIGVLGCTLLNPDRSLQASVRRFPTILSQGAILVKLYKIFPRMLNAYLAKDFDYAEEADVDQVMGAFFCIRASVCKEVGMLDEGYFIWFEEVDFCKRVKDAGYKVRYWPGCTMVHYGGQSFAQRQTLKKQWWFFKSMVRYFRKHIS